MKSLGLLGVFVFCICFLACSSCEPQAPRLRSADRKLVDSLYLDKVAILKVEMDSLCELSMKERVDYAVDSIMTLRIEERKKRLGY